MAVPHSPIPNPQSPLSAYRRGQIVAAYAFLAAPLALFLVFRVVPVLHALYLSFTEYGVLKPPVWSGLENYLEALRHDELFWTALRNTVLYAAGIVPGVMLGGLALALLLNSGIRAIPLFRASYYLPVVTSMIAAAVIWAWIFEPSAGLANYLLGLAGISPKAWLADPRLALPALIAMRIWKGAGYHMVIYLAGLQSIPPDLYEAAAIDGASAWQRLRRVTLPLLTFTFLFDFVIATSGALQSFEEIQVMTHGGPANATTTMVFLIYQNGFDFLRMGYAAAQGFLLFVVILALSLVGMRFFRGEVVY